jgi:SAM-dependent methyltransferase
MAEVAEVPDDARGNRTAWQQAAEKYVREHDELLAEARAGGSLTAGELAILEPLLRTSPRVVHLLSGHGLDDVGLVRAGARQVVGVDFSSVTAGAADRRAAELELSCAYVIAEVPPVPLADGCAELVYTGKGAVIWLADLGLWAAEIARILVRGGHLFVHEAHPLVPLWTWDTDEPRVRPDRSYFARSHVNDTFPGHGAVERQWTLGQILTALADAGLSLVSLTEHPEPFWRPDGLDAAVWDGRVPNTYTLLARRD